MIGGLCEEVSPKRIVSLEKHFAQRKILRGEIHVIFWLINGEKTKFEKLSGLLRNFERRLKDLIRIEMEQKWNKRLWWRIKMYSISNNYLQIDNGLKIRVSLVQFLVSAPKY
jgi:hypothetical protein